MRLIRASGLSMALLLLTACTQPGETTGVAAATGGAIGAGLGAIVGGSTGAAGAGLAIGAVSGAATGALIGNALEAREKANHTEDEAIARQQQMIAAHGRQLEELKTVQNDSGTGHPYFNKATGTYSNGSAAYHPSASSTGAASSDSYGARDVSVTTPATSGVSGQMGYSYPGSTMRLDPATREKLARGEVVTVSGQPAAQPDVTRGSFYAPSGAIAPSAHTSSHAEVIPPAPRAAFVASAAKAAPVAIAPVRSIPAAPPAKRVLATKTDSSGLVEKDLALPEDRPVVNNAKADTVNEAIPQAPSASDTIPVVSAGEAAGAKAADTSEAIPSQPAPDTVARAAQKPADAQPNAECQQAADEVTKADGSSEVADRLFHYRRALRLCPDNAQYHLGLGQVYASLNRKMDAEFEFREALRLKPDMSEAKQSLDSVRY